MTTEVDQPRNLGNVISSSNICGETKSWIHSQARGLYLLRETFGDLLTTNPKFHFTTVGFVFHPDNPEGGQKFQKQAEGKGWKVKVHENGDLTIKTGYIDDMRQNGLRPMSCVAAMPDNADSLVLLSYPRLFMESVRRTVRQIWRTCHTI